MEALQGQLLFVVAALTIVFYLLSKRKPGRNVPGPWCLPIVGYLPFVDKPLHVKFNELAQKYGPVFRVQLGCTSMVVLNSYEAMKDTLIRQNEAFSGRPDKMPFRILHEETAFAFEEGPFWKDIRMFCINSLRELGFGRMSLEPAVQDEIFNFMEELGQFSPTEKIEISKLLYKSVGSTLCSLMTGYKYHFDDPWFKQMITTLRAMAATFTNGDITLFYPWITKTPIICRYFDNVQGKILKKRLWDLWQEKIDEMKKIKDPSNCSLVSMWLREQETREMQNHPNKEYYSESNLLSNLDVLCQASFETSSATLQWALINMLSDPIVEERLYKEVDDVFGANETPTFNDAMRMPYTRAFIQENHRFSSIAALSVFHATREPASALGFELAERTTVVTNLWAVHHDPKSFPDPFKFDPTRYLDSNGNFVKHDSVIPFSVGKRVCPGEFVAQMKLFLYWTNMLQKFRFEVPEGETLRLDNRNTTLQRPIPFRLLLKKRLK